MFIYTLFTFCSLNGKEILSVQIIYMSKRSEETNEDNGDNEYLNERKDTWMKR